MIDRLLSHIAIRLHWYRMIERRRDVCSGQPVLRGTRLTTELFVRNERHWLNANYDVTHEQITAARWYEGLPHRQLMRWLDRTLDAWAEKRLY